MDKKLESIIHLYLGCDIKVWSDNYKGEIFKLTPTFLDLIRVPHYTIKPILRQLSSMTEEERDTFEGIAFNDNFKLLPWKYDGHFEVTRWMLSKHFDLFGLIESGLAIDSATLNH